MDEKKFYTVSEAAHFLGVARPTMYNYLNSGAIPGVKLNGKTWKVPAEPLKRLANGTR
ncbi:MAG: helix-turn-helix domain-containing protein [Oscillospiraceae bacterium]|nr:helix-turn-helix domain-containing protein [Oscillospiraceae bacterium]